MKKLVAAAAVLLTAITLAGCAGGDPSRTTTDSGWVTAQYVDLPDGRKVICVMSDTISCDWENAK